MPLLADLSAAVRSKVNIAEPKTFLDSFGDNIEMVLTYLSQSHPWLAEAENLRNRALFLELSSAVGDVLLDAMRKAAERPCPQWLQSLIQHWETTRAHVITLNYDTLVESAASLGRGVGSEAFVPGLLPEEYYPFPMAPLNRWWDEFRDIDSPRSSFRLFKLHGSVNWLYSGSAASLAETVYYAAGDNIWSQFEHRFVGPSDKIPLIVPPIADKVGYFQHPHVRGIWRDAAAALRSASKVFCLGYSLPVLDITMRFFLGRNHPTGTTPFFLVDLCNLENHFREILQPAGVYELNTQYIEKPDPIPNLVKTLVDNAEAL